MLRRNANATVLCGARARRFLAQLRIYNKLLTALVKLVLLVVNSIKLHLTAFKSLLYWYTRVKSKKLRLD